METFETCQFLTPASEFPLSELPVSEQNFPSHPYRLLTSTLEQDISSQDISFQDISSRNILSKDISSPNISSQKFPFSSIPSQTVLSPLRTSVHFYHIIYYTVNPVLLFDQLCMDIILQFPKLDFIVHIMCLFYVTSMFVCGILRTETVNSKSRSNVST